MPSEVTEQNRLPSMCTSPLRSSFSDEMRNHTEREVGGLWMSESMPDHYGMKEVLVMPGSKHTAPSPLEMFQSSNINSEAHCESQQSHFLKEQNTKFGLQYLMESERASGLSMAFCKSNDYGLGAASDVYAQPVSLYMKANKADVNGVLREDGLFSSSLPDIFSKKYAFSSNDALFGQQIDSNHLNIDEDEPLESLKEIEAQTIGSLLPDDDDLLSGVVENFDYTAKPSNIEDAEDDIFFTLGGMELEVGDGQGSNRSSGVANMIFNGTSSGVHNSSVGEHPYGEHPSRTLFVRNINSNVEDDELRALFEQHGDIRTLYTACKQRGFVMISYYDIRSARNAMRALQNKPLRRRKLDIHYSIPKDNPSGKDMNQGTLVVFNLDSSVSNDDIHQIFGSYGEIKEIRESPQKLHHKFIEFYDVRAAEAALLALNMSDIAGKQIKVEPSHTGGAKWSLISQFPSDLELGEANECRQQGSSLRCSPSIFHGTSGDLFSVSQGIVSPVMDTVFSRSSSTIPHTISSPARVLSMSNHSNESGIADISQSMGRLNFGFQGVPDIQPHSLPEYRNGLAQGIPYNPTNMSAMFINVNRNAEGIDDRHLHTGSPFDHNDGAYRASGNAICPLHGHQYIRNNQNLYHQSRSGHMIWPNSPSYVNNITAHPSTQLHALPRAPRHLMNNVGALHPHHVGSAPTADHSPWDRRLAYAGNMMEASTFHPSSLGSMGFSGSPTLHHLELASHGGFPFVDGNCVEPSISSPHVGTHSPQQRFQMFNGRNTMIPLPTRYEAANDRIRSRRSESCVSQGDNKKQFELDIERIIRGEDTRTTLMIKNIPNKYTSKMLLATIDEHHHGTYDFIYLPIDFKNKCNVGYAFINIIDPQQIIPFYKTFNGKKWEKFNSEKVASLAYARIQGKSALIAHFQNSSLMNEDKRCRPILFHSDGPNAGDQEPFPIGINIRSRPGRPRNHNTEDDHHGSPPNYVSGEETSNGINSAAGSLKESE